MGDENIFIFGMSTAEVRASRHNGYHPMRHYDTEPDLRAVLDAIAGDRFSPREPGRYRALVDSLLWGGDHYMLLADFRPIWRHRHVSMRSHPHPETLGLPRHHNVAGMGPFSADRTIRASASDIWRVAPVPAAAA